MSNDDLIQAGSMGLLKAAETYDVDNKYKASFFTYSYFSIKNEMLAQMNRHKEMIRIPRTRREDTKFVI